MNMKERDFNKKRKRKKKSLREKLNKTDLKNIFVFRDPVDIKI